MSKNFEFSEHNLTSDIDPRLIIRALKRRYGFKKITKATLKHVLYEGARLNRILQINDSCYEKMVEILNIPLDFDEESENDEHKSLSIDQPVCIHHLAIVNILMPKNIYLIFCI